MVQLQGAALLQTHVLDTVRHRTETIDEGFINKVRRLNPLLIGLTALTETKRNTDPHPQVPGAVGEVQKVVEILQRRMGQYDVPLLRF